MKLIKQSTGAVSNRDFSYEEIMEAKAFNDVLSSIEEKYGIEAVEEIVEHLGDKNPSSYNVFLKHQSVAKQLGDSDYWEVGHSAE